MKIGGNVYLTVAPDNAGTLTDVSETGISFNLVFPLQVKQRASFGFQLPGVTARTLVACEVVWVDSGGTRGGAALTYSEDFLQQITEWRRISSGHPQPNLTGREATDEQPAMAGDNNQQPITTSFPDNLSPWQMPETGNDDVADLRSVLSSHVRLEKKDEPSPKGPLAIIKWLRSNRRTAGLAVSVLALFAALASMVYLRSHPGFKVLTTVKSVLSSLRSPTQSAQNEDATEPTAIVRGPKRRPERVSGSMRSTGGPIYRSASRIPANAFEVSGTLQTRIIFGGNTRTIEFLPSANASAYATAIATVAQTYSGLVPELHEPPVYPDQLLERGIQGEATVEAVIDPAGTVKSVTIIAGDPLLAAVVSDAVKRWRYRQFERDQTGQAPATTRVFVRFTILPN
jgi:TonB family protein